MPQPSPTRLRSGHNSTRTISVSGLGREGQRPRGEAPPRFPFAHLQRARRGPRGCRWPAVCLARPPLHACAETRVWAGRPACETSATGRWCWRAGRAARSGLCVGTPPGARSHRPHLQAQDGAGVSSRLLSAPVLGPPRFCRRKTLSPPPTLSGPDLHLWGGCGERTGPGHTSSFTCCKESARPTKSHRGPDCPRQVRQNRASG